MALKARGSTAFISACALAASNVSEGSCVLALTDGVNNSGLGFDHCLEVGSVFRERLIQFSLVVPFSDFNYCNLSALKPLYTVCDGDILYPRVDEIEKAFADSLVPIAYKAIMTVKKQEIAEGPFSTVSTVNLAKVTKNSFLYTRFDAESGCSLIFDLVYSEADGTEHTIQCVQPTAGEQSIAEEFLTKSLALRMKEEATSGVYKSRECLREYIESVGAELGLSSEFINKTKDMFLVLNQLMATPALAKTPSQRDHVSGLIHVLSSNPSAGVPSNL